MDNTFIYIPNMINEMFLPGEALAAVGAGVRRHACVLPDVVVEMLLAREGPRAVRALVWRFSRVLSAQQSTFRFHNIITTCQLVLPPALPREEGNG